MDNITYRKATIADVQPVTKIALLLYDEHTFDEIFEKMPELLDKDSEAVFLAFDGEKPIGFSECSLRNDYVEGTHGGTIGYLEGIYVLPEYRRQGIAKSLAAVCEKWAEEKGCKEFASDCQLSNTDSYHFHLGIGFEDAGRIICFVKKLK